MANLVDIPEDLADVGWSKTNALVDDNAITAPDGFLTADRLKDNGATGVGVVRVQDVISGLTPTASHIYSGFIKKDQLDWGFFAIDALGIAASCFVDAANGVLGTVGADVDSSGIEDYGNGWFRAWFTFTTTADVSGLQRIYPANSDGVTTVDLDGTSSIFWWGMMLEPGTTLNPYVSDNGVTVVPVVPEVPSKKGGHISRRKPHIVFVDQDPEEPELEPEEEKRILRMTPEVKAMLDRYRKGKDAKANGGLLGNKKGLID